MSFQQVLKKQFANNINNQGIRKKKIFTKSIKIGETKPITPEQIFENRFKFDKILGEIVNVKSENKSAKKSSSDNSSPTTNPIHNFVNFNECSFEDINETYDKLYESIYDGNYNLIKAIHQNKNFTHRFNDLAEFKNSIQENKENEDHCGKTKSEKIMNMKNKKYFKTNRNKKSYEIEKDEILEAISASMKKTNIDSNIEENNQSEGHTQLNNIDLIDTQSEDIMRNDEATINSPKINENIAEIEKLFVKQIEKEIHNNIREDNKISIKNDNKNEVKSNDINIASIRSEYNHLFLSEKFVKTKPDIKYFDNKKEIIKNNNNSNNSNNNNNNINIERNNNNNNNNNNIDDIFNDIHNQNIMIKDNKKGRYNMRVNKNTNDDDENDDDSFMDKFFRAKI